MPFPKAVDAVINVEKIKDYLLDKSHPVGGSKAKLFESIGYSLKNWQDFADDLLTLARESENYLAKPSPFGIKYEVRGKIGKPGYRLANIVSVWIVENEKPPRLITAFPE
jgi:hypothetical protein